MTMFEGKVAVVTAPRAASAAPLRKSWAARSEGRRDIDQRRRRGQGPRIGKLLNVRDTAQMDAFIDEVQKQVGDIAILVTTPASPGTTWRCA